MMYDGMFTAGEYPACKGWGHSTWEKGVELARAANVRALAVIHLHPRHDDDELRAIEAAMQQAMPSAFIARERQALTLGKGAFHLSRRERSRRRRRRRPGEGSYPRPRPHPVGFADSTSPKGRGKDVPLAAMIVLAVIAASALISAGLIVWLRPLLVRYALARPNARSSHTVPTPQGGGIAVLAATLAVVAVALAVCGGGAGDALIVGAAAVGLAVVGAIDDIRPLATLPRLVLQFAAVALVVAAATPDVRVLPAWVPPGLERAFLVVGGVWFVNLVNFMDGLDWMTVAEVVPIAACLAALGGAGVVPAEAALVAAALLGAVLGFAPANKPVARLFLGDVGSLPIGLLLGWLLLELAAAGALAAALLLPLYYLADATITLARRLARGERVWQAHRSHFYQQAADHGFSVHGSGGARVRAQPPARGAGAADARLARLAGPGRRALRRRGPRGPAAAAVRDAAPRPGRRMSGPLVASPARPASSGAICCAGCRGAATACEALLRRPAALPPEATGAVVGDLPGRRTWRRRCAASTPSMHSAGHRARHVGRARGRLPRPQHRGDGRAGARRRAGRRERFVFLSSIRAQSGPAADGVLTEELDAARRPTPMAARSSPPRRGWRSSASTGSRCGRSLVYGAGVQGNMAALAAASPARPARCRSAACTARRSLLSVENLADAVDVALRARRPLRRPFIVADPEPSTVAGA